MDTLTVVAAYIGAITGLTGLAAFIWQVWQHIDSTKPRIEVRMSLVGIAEHQLPRLHADVWNSGRVPVYIEEVLVLAEHIRPAKGAKGLAQYPVSRGIYLVSRDPDREPLQPGQGRQYWLPDEAAGTCKGFLEIPEEDLSLVVKSLGKVIRRVEGKNLRHILDTIATAAEAKKPGL